MPSLYKVVKTSYRAVIPVGMRGPFHNPNTRFGRWSCAILKWLESMGSHDELYDNDYYQRIVEPAAQSSAPIIAATIVGQFAPSSVIDVGCGSGAVLSAFKALGISTFGIDYAKAAVDLCRSRGLDVQRFDIESGQVFTRSADVVLSTEVAEHLPEPLADAYVSILTGIAPIIIITAATPGQGGTDHVNEQPNTYWIQKFHAAGFDYLEEMSQDWRAAWQTKNISKTYCTNLMIFRRKRMSPLPSSLQPATRGDTSPPPSPCLPDPNSKGTCPPN